MIRSATSSALNYAKARFAESKKDFVHKAKIVLKELQENRACIMLIMRSGISNGSEEFYQLLEENGALIAIFFSSVNTVQKSFRKEIDK